MSDDFNPYAAPTDATSSSLRDDRSRRHAGPLTYVAWVFVFAVNMALPLLLSASVTREHGTLGMSVAALLLLALGCFICATRRKLATTLIGGGVLVGLSQLFPALHIIAGMIGMTLAQALGLADNGGNDGRSPLIINEYGGFVVTFVTGSILMAVAACTGMLIRFVTPACPWPKSERAGDS
jgi:hypothetical protein